jgi:hypothetical protein
MGRTLEFRFMYGYHKDDFDTYARLFSEESTRIVELMRILDEKINTELDMHSVRPKDLFRMVMDLSYDVDRTYKKEKNIQDETYTLTTFASKDEIFSQMRTALKEEFQRYLDGVNGDAK